MSVTVSQGDLLGRLMDLASARHQAISQNIANVNTPGFRRLDVTFDEAMLQRLQSDSGAKPPKPQLVEAGGGAERADGNNVDIDTEIGRLSKNTLLYNAYVQIMASKLAAMRSAISGK